MTIQQIIERLRTLSQKPIEQYSIGDRQEIHTLQLDFAPILANAKREASESDEERKRHRAKQMLLLSWTEKTRESTIYESDEYQEYVMKKIKAQYIVDLCTPIQSIFSALTTVVRDAEKQIGEEIK